MKWHMWSDMKISSPAEIDFSWKPEMMSMDDDRYLRRISKILSHPNAILINKGVHEAFSLKDIIKTGFRRRMNYFF
jgi:hypothetical protein